ncbi:hypothetical protein D9M71_784140 [compost metagenome]
MAVLLGKLAGIQLFPLQVTDLLAQLAIGGAELGAPGGAGQFRLGLGSSLGLTVFLQALAKDLQPVAQDPVTGLGFLVAFQGVTDGFR